MRKAVILICLVLLFYSVISADEFTLFNNPFLGTAVSPAPNVASDGMLWLRGGPDSVVRFDPSLQTYDIHRIGPDGYSKGIAIDTEGGIWVASYKKMDHIFDGRIETCKFEESIGAIAAAPDGSVWASLWAGETGRWVVRFQDGDWETVPGGPEACAMRICFEDDGTGWFARASMTTAWLARYSNGLWTTFDKDLPADEILGMDVRQQGEVWLVNWSLVYQYQDGEFVRTFWHGDGLAGYMPNCLEIDRDGRVWVGDYVRGLSMFDGQSWTIYDSTNSELPADRVNGIAASPEGAVFCCTDEGLAWIKDGEWDTFEGDTLISNDVHSVVVNDQGHVYYGTESGDVGRWVAPNWEVLDDPEGTESNPIYDISLDRNGALWFGQTDLVRVYTGSFTDYLTAGLAGISLREARSLGSDSDGAIWICVQAGLARYDGQAWMSWETGSGMSPQCLACDDQGNVWVAIPQGVAVFNDDALTHWFPQYANVKAMTCDHDDIIWLGLENRQLIEFDGENQIAVHEPYGWYATEKLLSLACDTSNNIWVGASTGVHYFDRLEWGYIGVGSGFPCSNEVRDIYAAPNGDVWFATPAGLICWEFGIAPPQPTISIMTDATTYSAGDTMTVTMSYENPGPDISIDIYTACQLPDGTLYYHPGGFTPTPFTSGMLSSGAVVPMVLVMTYDFDGAFFPGDYVWMAGMFEQGSFDMVSDIATAPWRFE